MGALCNESCVKNNGKKFKDINRGVESLDLYVMDAKHWKYSCRYKTMGSYRSMYKTYCYVERKLGNIENKEEKYSVTLKCMFIKEKFGPYSIILPKYRGTYATGF